MCLIAVCDTEHLSEKQINNAFKTNSHGAGVAWFRGNTLHFAKGLSLGELTALYDSEVKYSLPHVVHFRIATSGGVSSEMCHPFIISKDSELRLEGTSKRPLLFHNGVYGDWKSMLVMLLLAQGKKLPVGGDPWSDTRTLAVAIHHLGEGVLGITGRCNKFAVIDPATRGVRTYGNFTREGGVLFSNNTYSGGTFWYNTGYGGGAFSSYFDDEDERNYYYYGKYGHRGGNQGKAQGATATQAVAPISGNTKPPEKPEVTGNVKIIISTTDDTPKEDSSNEWTKARARTGSHVIAPPAGFTPIQYY